jgi:hypothetical protein
MLSEVGWLGATAGWRACGEEGPLLNGMVCSEPVDAVE